jgi:DNA end-binding protein Ku
VWRGKENIYLIRPAKGGLLLHRMYYADEVRDFGEIPKGNPEVNDQEMKLAMQLIDSISQAEFKPESFHDSYRQRVLEMIETKTQGRSVAVEPKAKPAPVVNLMDALKRSLEHHEVGKKEQARPVAAPADRTPRKKAHAGRK